MPTLAGHLRAHPRLLLALAIGTVAGTVFARGSAVGRAGIKFVDFLQTVDPDCSKPFKFAGDFDTHK